MSAELESRYEAEAARLVALIEEHERDRRNVRYFLVGVAVAPFGLFFHPLAAGGIAFVSLSFYFCGLYLSSMHYWDRTEQLRRVQRELTKLRRGAPDAPGTLAAPASPG